jgi:hypothetical protein
MDIRQVTEKSEYLQQPDDNNNYNNNVDDRFDFMVHGDVCIDQP